MLEYAGADCKSAAQERETAPDESEHSTALKRLRAVLSLSAAQLCALINPTEYSERLINTYLTKAWLASNTSQVLLSAWALRRNLICERVYRDHGQSWAGQEPTAKELI